MSQRITIEIKDKIATCLTELPIVCGNADYVVDFAFDEEWEKHEVKTAMFVVNGTVIPQVFAGTVCPVPVIQNTLIAWVGVFAGTIDDGTLSTSTPALVKCIPCITDGDKVPTTPPDDVYNQIIGLINAGMLRGERGEKGEKGEKGDAGSMKFIPVVELPTENIDESAFYLVPIENSDGENRFKEYAYVNGAWEPFFEITIEVDHSEYVKFTDIANDNKAGVLRAVATFGLTVDKYGRGTIVKAEKSDIDAKTNEYKPIVPKTLEYAVMKALTDLKDTTLWTEENKEKAKALLGVEAGGGGSSAKRYKHVLGGFELDTPVPVELVSIVVHSTRQTQYANMNEVYEDFVYNNAKVMFYIEEPFEAAPDGIARGVQMATQVSNNGMITGEMYVAFTLDEDSYTVTDSVTEL